MRGTSASAALLLAIVAVTGLAQSEADELPDPIPLRRVVLPAEKLPAELKRAQDGVLVRLERKEFEKLVQKAARASKDRQHRPALIEARYRARLVESKPLRPDEKAGYSLAGSAQWKIQHKGRHATLMRLASEGAGINLAIRRPRYENRDALLTEFPDPQLENKGRLLALLVDQPGQHTLTFEWSARVEPRPDGLQVDLRVPDCPAASFELELPEDRAVTAMDGSLVTGPHQAEAADRRLWRIAGGGKTQLPLLLRKNGPGRPSAVLMSRQKMVQRLTPDGLEATGTFSLEGLHQDVRELFVEMDPLLRPVEVTAPGLEHWKIASPAAGQPDMLTIRLARPLREGIVEVRCLAPFSARTDNDARGSRSLVVPWTSPGMRLVNAVPRGETLELWLHPEFRLLSWEPGDYRLIDSVVVPDLDKKTLYSRLTLQGGGLMGGEANRLRRPGGQVQIGGVEFRARQQSWWRLAEGGMDLVTQIDYDVRQGQLFQLPLRLPAGWDVETVETTPPDLLRSWGLRKDRSGMQLLADLRRPLRPGAREGTSTLTVRLRQAGAIRDRELAFPDVIPVGARFREGGLAIDFDEQVHRARVHSPLRPGDPPTAGIWGKLVPDYYYPFQVQELHGTLRLALRPPRFRARVAQDLVVLGRQAALESRLIIEGEAGAPSAFAVYLASGDARPWDWRVQGSRDVALSSNRVRRVERLHGLEAAVALTPLAASSPLGAAILATARPRGTYWRIWLERPLPVGRELMLRATPRIEPMVTQGTSGLRWQVPLATVLHTSRHDAQVTLHLTAGNTISMDGAGLSEAPAHITPPRSSIPGLDDGPTLWRGFRYSDPQARLTIETQATATGPQIDTIVDRVRLTSLFTPENRLRHHFRFRLARWPQRTLPVILPANAHLLGASIDGQWLEHLRVDDNGHLLLPVPGGSADTFELLYTTPTSREGLRIRLSAPIPGLPVPPSTFERRWLLPPDVLPSGDARAFALPAADAPRGPRSVGNRLLDLFRPGPLNLRLRGPRTDPRGERQQLLYDAFAGLRGERTGEQPLATYIEDLATGYLRESHPLVIDGQALMQAGMSTMTLLRISPLREGEEFFSPWDHKDLVILPLRAGVLLTTRTERQRWSNHEPPASIESAIARATELGQDPSGRFVTALEWLRPERSATILPGLFTTGANLDGWSGWAPIPGSADDDLVVVSTRAIRLIGMFVAAVLLTGSLLVRRWPARRRLRLLLVWLGLAGFSVAWLPSAWAELAWWPLVAALAVAVPWYLLWASRSIRQPAGPGSSLKPAQSAFLGSTTSAVVILLLVGVAHGPAQPVRAEPEVIFLLPLAAGETEPSVLASKRLITQLETMARQNVASAAVLVSGSYEGKVVEARAEFTATFSAYVPHDEPATVELPLENVQLVGDVLVDGARVLPVALAAPRSGYALRLRGQGRHKVELRFQTAVARGGEDRSLREIRFSVPPLVESRVVCQAPPGARYLRVPVKYGGQRVSLEGDQPRIEADLGAITTPLRIRWNQLSTEPRPARIEYREAYLWDLRADASLLTALVRYSIRGSGVTSLVIDLPDELEVRAVQVRRPALDKPLSGEAKSVMDAIRLHDWIVQGTGAKRTVRLEFPAPVWGEVEASLELMPRAPWASSVLLPIPRPRGQPQAEELGYLAYRRQGVDVTRTSFRRVKGIPLREFAPFWPASTKPLFTALDYASSFRRDPKQPPELRLALRAASPRLQASQTVSWLVRSAQAELSARVDLDAPDTDLSLIEWEVASPSRVMIARVTGPEVSRWSQSGNRLLVWLEKTTRAAQIEITGWGALAPLAGAQGRFDVPCLRLIHPQASSVQTRLTVSTIPGLMLASQGVRNLSAIKPDVPGTLTFATKQPSYAGQFAVHQGPAPKVEVMTTARLVGKELTFSSIITYRQQGELRAVSVRLRGWEGDAWIDLPPASVTRRREQHRRAPRRQERLWDLELTTQIRGEYRLVVRGRLPIDELSATTAIPQIVIPGVATRQTLVIEETLTAESATGIETIPAPTGAAAGARAWNVRDEEWSLRVAPREQARAEPAQVLLAELRVSVGDGQGWLHEARYWLRHDAPTELGVRLGPGGRPLSMQLDGIAIPLRESQNDVLWIPLSGATGTRELLVCYRREGNRENLHRPDLTPPRLEGARAGPMVWTIDVPPGWELASAVGGTRLGSGATRRAVLELHKAAQALTLCRELPAQQVRLLSDLQRRFAHSCWLAELALEAGADSGRLAGPNQVPLSSWLIRLRQQNQTLARDRQFEAIAEEADRQKRESPAEAERVLHAGTSYSWIVERGNETPIVRLAPQGRREVRQALAFTGQWLIVLLAIWAVAASSILRTFVRWLWPEQVFLVGAIAWQLVGPTVVVLLVLALGTAGRLALAGRGLQGLLRRPSLKR